MGCGVFRLYDVFMWAFNTYNLHTDDSTLGNNNRKRMVRAVQPAQPTKSLRQYGNTVWDHSWGSVRAITLQDGQALAPSPPEEVNVILYQQWRRAGDPQSHEFSSLRQQISFGLCQLIVRRFFSEYSQASHNELYNWRCICHMVVDLYSSEGHLLKYNLRSYVGTGP